MKNNSKKKSLSIRQTAPTIQDSPSYHCTPENGLAGFGNNVMSVRNKKSQSVICYINDTDDISFVKPVHINELKDIIKYLESDQNPYQQVELLNKTHG